MYKMFAKVFDTLIKWHKRCKNFWGMIAYGLCTEKWMHMQLDINQKYLETVLCFVVDASTRLKLSQNVLH